MTRPINRPKLNGPSLTVIQGGQAYWNEANLRTVFFPTVMALPFIKLKKDHQPGWRPESFWSIEPSGRYSAQRKLGQSYARDLVAAMRADRCAPSVLGSVLLDVIRDCHERGEESALVVGFLHELARILVGAPDGSTKGRA